MAKPDAVIVGAGPNGLAAAIELARAGRSVRVYEANGDAGGGCRTEEITRPGFRHDTCAAVFPMAAASPFFASLGLEPRGLVEWIHPPKPLAHPTALDRAVVLERSIRDTAHGLGADGPAYRRWLEGLPERWPAVAADLLGPIRIPRSPMLMARIAASALRSARGLMRGRFSEDDSRALLAGMAGHGVIPFDRPGSAAVAFMLTLTAHVNGWPIPKGGAGRITEALVRVLVELGGEVRTASPVASLNDLPEARITMLDLTPRQVLRVAGDRLPRRYARALSRYRYAPGVFKLDWALSEPIPWRVPEVGEAGTVHLGGGHAALEVACAAPHRGEVAPRPFVILAQPSRFDDTRAPPGRHTAWGYCHVPHGYTGDRTEAIEAQVERYAPGFRDVILERRARGPAALERGNANLVGGDIGGGLQDLRQTIFRPVPRWNPYATPVKGLFLCSASTPPGGGVHGMAGYHAARAALSRSG